MSVLRAVAWKGSSEPGLTPPPPSWHPPPRQGPYSSLVFQPFNHGHKVAKFCYADKVSLGWELYPHPHPPLALLAADVTSVAAPSLAMGVGSFTRPGPPGLTPEESCVGQG